MTYNKTKRNYLGLACWLIVACIINLLALIPMTLREKKQAKQGNFPIEWEDIAFYTFAILCGSGINAALIQWMCSM